MDQHEVQEDLLRGKLLSIGLGTALRVRLGGMDGHFNSSMVGVEPGQFLIMQLPMMTGIINKLYEGNRATVRYMYSGSIYGFRASILHYITKPSPLIFLTYPKSIEILQLRSSKRVDCFFSGRVDILGKEIPVAIVDISTGGCKFNIETTDEIRVPHMEVGENVNLSFKLIGSLHPHTFRGKVRSICRDQGQVVVGIQFEDLDAEIAKRIEVLIDSFWAV